MVSMCLSRWVRFFVYVLALLAMQCRVAHAAHVASPTKDSLIVPEGCHALPAVPGGCNKVSAAGEYTVVLNKAGQAFQLHKDGSQWVPLAGAVREEPPLSATQVQTGMVQQVWGANANGEVWVRQGIDLQNKNGTRWDKVDFPGHVTCIAVGLDKNKMFPEVWVTANPPAADNEATLWRRIGFTHQNPVGTAWQQVTKNIVRFWPNWDGAIESDQVKFYSIMVSAEGTVVAIATVKNDPHKPHRPMVLKDLSADGTWARWQILRKDGGWTYTHGGLVSNNGQELLVCYTNDGNRHLYSWDSLNKDDNPEYGWDWSVDGAYQWEPGLLALGYINGKVLIYHLGTDGNLFIPRPGGSELSFSYANHGNCERSIFNMARVAVNNLGLWLLGSRGDRGGGENPQKASAGAREWPIWTTTNPISLDNALGKQHREGWVQDYARDGVVQPIDGMLREIATCHRPYFELKTNFEPGRPGGPLGTPLVDVSVAADGTVWGVGSDGLAYRRSSVDGMWQKYRIWTRRQGTILEPGFFDKVDYPGRVIAVAVGSPDEVWVVTDKGDLFRKTDAAIASDGGWLQVPGTYLTAPAPVIASGNDGEVWVVDAQRNLRQILRDRHWFPNTKDAARQIAKPTELFHHPLLDLQMCDKHTVVAVTDDDFKAYRLDFSHSKKENLKRPCTEKNKSWPPQDWIGKEAIDWKELFPGSSLSARGIAVRDNGDVIVLDDKGNLFARPVDQDDTTMLDMARGPVIGGDQLLFLGTVPAHNTFKGYPMSRWLWTWSSGSVPEYSVAGAQSGLGTMTVIHRDHTPDDPAWIREWMGFCSFTHADNEKSREPIRYGDLIHIYTAATPREGKRETEILAKQRWRWLVSNSNIANTTSSWCPLIVADKTYAGIKDNNDVFQLQSPDGSRQGEPVRANDAFVLLSQAPYVKNQRLWVDDRWSPWGGEYHGALKVSVGMNDYDPGYLFGGVGAASASQLLTARVLNQVTDVWDVVGGDTVLQGSPLDTYNRLKGNYFQDEGFVQKEKIQARQSQEYGRGLLEEIQNRTQFPLTVIGEETGKQPATLATIAKEESFDAEQVGDLRKRVITLKGFAQTDPALSYVDGMQIELGSMGSQGTLWCERALATPGNVTITFVGLAGADGNLQLVFDTFDAADDAHTLNPRLRIVLGHHLSDQVRNAETAIIFASRKVASTTKDQNIFAQVVPGTPMPYWVTLNDGFVAVGLLNEKGDPGDNLILAAYIPEVATFNRVGFSSHRDPVIYADFRIGQTLGPVVDDPYLSLPISLQLPASAGSLSFLRIQTPAGVQSNVLRVYNEGALAFTAQAKYAVSTIFASAEGGDKPLEYYEVVYGDESNSSIRVLRKSKRDAAPKVAYCFDMSDLLDLQFSKEHPSQRLWISLQGGTFMIGHIGEKDEGFGSNVIAAWNDPQPLQGISRVGFRSSDHQQVISNIVMAPPVDLAPELADETGIKKIPTNFYSTKLVPYRPCYYSVAQNGAVVVVKDMISGAKFPVVASAVPHGIYPFNVIMGKDGIPTFEPLGDADMTEAQKLAWAAEDVTLQKIADFNRAAMEASAKSNFIMTVADTTMRGVESATTLAANAAGTAMQGGPIGVAVGAGLMAGAVVTQTVAAAGYAVAGGLAAGAQKEATQQAYEAQALQDRLALQQQRDALAQQTAAMRQINLQQVSREQQLTAQIPQTALDHQAEAVQALAQLQQLSFVDALEQYLTIFLTSVLLNIDHPYVVQDAGVKKRIIAGLERIMSAYATIPEQFQPTVFQILCLAYGNEYLTSRDSRDDVSLRESWYGKIVELGQSFMSSSSTPGAPLSLSGLRGEYIWSSLQLQNPDNGWVSLEVQAPGPLFIAFGQESDRVQGIGADNQIYEIVVGLQDPESKTGDQMHLIRVTNLGRAASILRERDNRGAMLKRGWNPIWIRLENGLIEVGKGNTPDDTTVFMKWQDPYPWKGISCVGFSSWGEVPVTVRSIMVDGRSASVGTEEEVAAEDEATVTGEEDVGAEESLAVPEILMNTGADVKASSLRKMTCSICREGFGKEVLFVDSPRTGDATCEAQHLFHEDCLQQWFKTPHVGENGDVDGYNTTCPICRRDTEGNGVVQHAVVTEGDAKGKQPAAASAGATAQKPTAAPQPATKTPQVKDQPVIKKPTSTSLTGLLHDKLKKKPQDVSGKASTAALPPTGKSKAQPPLVEDVAGERERPPVAVPVS